MYDIFISYRRDGGHEMARLLYEHFRMKGLCCFFDLEELGAGEFNVKLLDSIEASKNFVLILSPNALERCLNEGDWVRCEIEHAIKHGKNIVPLMLSGFSWPENLPESLAKLPFYNGVFLVREYFDASLSKLIDLLVLDSATKAKATGTAPATAKAGVASWLERAFIFLEDGEWKKADTYAEKVLDADPKNGEAYLVKLMVELQVEKRENLANLEEVFDSASAYKMLVRYASDALKKEIAGYIDHIRATQEALYEDLYQKAVNDLANVRKKDACGGIANMFRSLGSYKDSALKVQECAARAKELAAEEKYREAEALAAKKSVELLTKAAEIFASLGEFKDAPERANECYALAKKKTRTIAAVAFLAVVLVILLAILLATISTYGNSQPIYKMRSDGTYELTRVGEKFNKERYEIPTTHRGKPVTSIGESAFYDCDSLASVTIPDSVTNIGGYAFYGCDSLASVTIPDSVTSIGESAFFMCDSLDSVTISDGVTSIGKSAFYGCDSLASITIPDSVTDIGENAFYDCDSLTTVTIPSDVSCIKSGTFGGCAKLKSVTIPKGVTMIEAESFYFCRNLTNVIYCGTKEKWNAIHKQEDWNFLSSFTVTCTDGIVEE